MIKKKLFGKRIGARQRDLGAIRFYPDTVKSHRWVSPDRLCVKRSGKQSDHDIWL